MRKFSDGDKAYHKKYGKGIVVDAFLSRKGSVHFVIGRKINNGWIRVAKRDLVKI